MKISYNKNLKIAGIGLVPWTRLGPERWLPQYKIASMQDWDVQRPGAPQVIAANNPQLLRANSQNLIQDHNFQHLLQTNLAGYKLLTYKPVIVPSPLENFSFLKNDERLSKRLENKAHFRNDMKAYNLPFPRYEIRERASIAETDIFELLAGREKIIMQDEILSGGKGTHVVHDSASLTKALVDIEHNHGGKTVVISEVVEKPSERSLQCCVTQHGIFVGPIQTQIVGDALLSNLAVADGDRYCGAQISPQDIHVDKYDEMKRIALVIGEYIRSLGYKGIYGIDFLVSEEGKVYVLEINPRITGVTPLLTMLHREDQDIPFYLLHILELAGEAYSIPDLSVNPVPPEGSLFVMHSQSESVIKLDNPPASGFYNPDSLEYQGAAYKLNSHTETEQLLLQQYMPIGAVIKPGGRTLTGYTNRQILNLKTGKLSEKFTRQVQGISKLV